MISTGADRDDVRESGHGDGRPAGRQRTIPELSELVAAPRPNRAVGQERQRVCRSGRHGEDVRQPGHLDRRATRGEGAVDRPGRTCCLPTPRRFRRRAARARDRGHRRPIRRRREFRRAPASSGSSTYRHRAVPDRWLPSPRASRRTGRRSSCPGRPRWTPRWSDRSPRQGCDGR